MKLNQVSVLRLFVASLSSFDRPLSGNEMKDAHAGRVDITASTGQNKMVEAELCELVLTHVSHAPIDIF